MPLTAAPRGARPRHRSPPRARSEQGRGPGLQLVHSRPRPPLFPFPSSGHGVWAFTVFIANKKGTGFLNKLGSCLSLVAAHVAWPLGGVSPV